LSTFNTTFCYHGSLWAVEERLHGVHLGLAGHRWVGKELPELGLGRKHLLEAKQLKLDLIEAALLGRGDVSRIGVPTRDPEELKRRGCNKMEEKGNSNQNKSNQIKSNQIRVSVNQIWQIYTTTFGGNCFKQQSGKQKDLCTQVSGNLQWSPEAAAGAAGAAFFAAFLAKDLAGTARIGAATVFTVIRRAIFAKLERVRQQGQSTSRRW
jgi:hypothetical protein